ncbi:MAG: bifunctional folylpolyglutamate synthase/dihydrofolate synthase [Acutalibacteraceae bacterium]
MTYKQALEYIDSFLVFGSKPGLKRIRNLMKLLGNVQDKLKYIHVAGTNGKGSVCAYAASALTAAGLNTGMFVSPYVLDYSERFQINGEPIPHDELCEIVAEIKSVIDGIDDEFMPTEFEVVTAIGLLWFYRRKCDVVVLEVGLGGLYDSTNIISTPLCSVICSISLDHTAILGDTVELIAEQKAGIVKPNGKTVMYPIQQSGAYDVIAKTARNMNNSLIVPDTDKLSVIGKDMHGITAEYDGLRFTTGIAGDVQVYNAITAIEAVRAAFPNVSDNAIAVGIAAAKMPARCEIIEQTRPIILDGAHNPDGVLTLKNYLTDFVKPPITAIIGMMRDKDVDTVLSELAPCFSKIITVTVNNPRSMTAVQLAEIAKKYCSDVVAADSVEKAAEMGLCAGGPLVVCGSFYLMSQIRQLLG